MNQPNDLQGDGDEDTLFDEATLATLEALETVLLELEAHPSREGTIPQWEFCEGFMTGLLCMRRPVHDEEWLPILLGGHEDDSLPLFDSPDQQTRFLMHWQERSQQLRDLLDAHVAAWEQGGDSDPFLLNPALMDWRGMAAAARAGLMEGADEDLLTDTAADADTDAEQDADDTPELPAYAQMWAMGFMAVAGLWAEDWTAPRNHELSEDWDDALDCVLVLTGDDTDTPEVNLMHEGAPPSVSQQRMEAVGEALFAVHDLYGMARLLGPRIEPVQTGPKIGRNDPCPCGSGKKYKQCCGA